MHVNSHNKDVGKKGEDVACVFLMKHGFKIIERNYLRKWGEIDIVGEQGGKLHFIEVKTVSRERFDNVTCVTSEYNPEDNVHFRKKQRLARVFQTFLFDKQKEHVDWYFHIVTVELCPKENKARVHIIKDIIL